MAQTPALIFPIFMNMVFANYRFTCIALAVLFSCIALIAPIAATPVDVDIVASACRIRRHEARRIRAPLVGRQTRTAWPGSLAEV